METSRKHSESQSAAGTSPERSQARLEFSKHLKEARLARGFRTARSLAKALSIDENRYTRYERAEVEPDLSLIRRICEALNITPNELLGTADRLDETAPSLAACEFSGNGESSLSG